MMVFGFLRFYLSGFFFFALVSSEKIYETLETVIGRI